MYESIKVDEKTNQSVSNTGRRLSISCLSRQAGLISHSISTYRLKRMQVNKGLRYYFTY